MDETTINGHSKKSYCIANVTFALQLVKLTTKLLSHRQPTKSLYYVASFLLIN